MQTVICKNEYLLRVGLCIIFKYSLILHFHFIYENVF